MVGCFEFGFSRFSFCLSVRPAVCLHFSTCRRPQYRYMDIPLSALSMHPDQYSLCSHAVQSLQRRQRGGWSRPAVQNFKLCQQDPNKSPRDPVLVIHLMFLQSHPVIFMEFLAVAFEETDTPDAEQDYFCTGEVLGNKLLSHETFVNST